VGDDGPGTQWPSDRDNPPEEGDVHETDHDPVTAGTSTTRTQAGQATTQTAGQGAAQAAGQAAESAGHAAREVVGTAAEQGRQLAGQVGDQTRSVVADVRRSVAGQLHTGHQQMADGLRRIADDLGAMTGERGDTPAGQLVQRLSESGRRAADYLQERGPEGLLDDVQDFARRRPGTFLLAAAAAGFVVGRLGRTTARAVRSNDATSSPSASTAPADGTAAGRYHPTAVGSASVPAPAPAPPPAPVEAPGYGVLPGPERGGYR